MYICKTTRRWLVSILKNAQDLYGSKLLKLPVLLLMEYCLETTDIIIAAIIP